MLGKLIKNEFSATSKVYLPLYALLLVLTFINKIFMMFRGSNLDLPQGLAMSAFVMVIMAIMVMTVVLTIQRFNKNILGDEGYLMHTLPVEKWQLIASKLIVAMTWTVAAIVVAVLSIIVLAYNQGMGELFGELWKVLCEVFQHAGIGRVLSYTFYGIVISILGLAFSYLPIYLSMALGYMSTRNKFLASVAWFIGLSFALQCVTTVGILIIDKLVLWQLIEKISATAQVHIVMWIFILFGLVLNAVCFFGTNYILKNKLNLE